MLLTIKTTHQPVREISYPLHKHPNRCQYFPVSFGQTHIFYAEASTQCFTATLLLNINPVKLLWGRSRSLDPNETEEKHDQEEAVLEKLPGLNQQCLRLLHYQWKRLQLIQNEFTYYNTSFKKNNLSAVINEFKH